MNKQWMLTLHLQSGLVRCGSSDLLVLGPLQPAIPKLKAAVPKAPEASCMYKNPFHISAMCRVMNGRRSGASGGPPWGAPTSGLTSGPKMEPMCGMRSGEKNMTVKGAASSLLTRYCLLCVHLGTWLRCICPLCSTIQ